MSFLEGGALSTIFTAVGVPTIIMFMYTQIRASRKEAKLLAEKNRLAITKEINDKADMIVGNMETKLEAIKVASIISKEDLEELRKQLQDLKSYVSEMDKGGTIDWQKIKPFFTKKMDELEERIDELYRRILPQQ